MPASRFTSRLRGAVGTALSKLARLRDRPRPIRFPAPASIAQALRPDVSQAIGYGRLVSERRIGEAQEALAKHFRHRTAPRFFLTPGQIAEAGAHVPAAWREQTLVEAGRWKGAVESASKWEQVVDASTDGTLRDLPHRLQFSIPLARAALYGEDTSAALRRLIELWKGENEGRPDAPGYSHPLLAVYRAVSLSWALAYLQAAAGETHALEVEIVRILFADAEYIHDRLGTSFPNNHLLADGFGLWYLGMLLPEFASAPEWRRAGEEVWQRELARQINEDGTSFEHAVHYQEFACEMGVLYWLLSARNDCAVPPSAAARIRGMVRFLEVLGGAAGQPPMFGDCVEGGLIALDSTSRTDMVAYAELARALFDMPGEVASGREPSERVYWLLGGTPESAPLVAAPRMESFPLGGVHVFGEAGRSTRLVFRTGPTPGMEVNPGHMHADLLSIYLDVEGEPLVVEAGTYTYRSGMRPDGVDWRAYFLGPGCHNGLLVEGEDPLARGAGDFPPGPPQSFVKIVGSREDSRFAWVEAEVTGTTSYAGCRRGVIHVRGRFWIVYDVVPERLPLVAISMGLQLAPHVVADVRPNGIRIVGERAGCWFVPGDSYGPVVVRTGETDPPAGWVSSRYGQITPAMQLRLVPSRRTPVHAFLLDPSRGAHTVPPRLSAQWSARGEIALDIVESDGGTTRASVAGGALAMST